MFKHVRLTYDRSCFKQKADFKSALSQNKYTKHTMCKWRVSVRIISVVCLHGLHPTVSENFLSTNLYICSYGEQMEKKKNYSNSGVLLSYWGGGVMGSMVTGFWVGLRIWRRKSFRCSLSDLILLTRRGRSKRLARLLLRAGTLGLGVGPGAGGSAAVWAGADALSVRCEFSLGLSVGPAPSFSTAAMMSS